MVNSQMIWHEENTFSLYLHTKWYTVKFNQGHKYTQLFAALFVDVTLRCVFHKSEGRMKSRFIHTSV